MAKSKVNIQPLADRVVVKAAEAETKTKSGIIIPDSAKEKPQRGIPYCMENTAVQKSILMVQITSL